MRTFQHTVQTIDQIIDVRHGHDWIRRAFRLRPLACPALDQVAIVNYKSKWSERIVSQVFKKIVTLCTVAVIFCNAILVDNSNPDIGGGRFIMMKVSPICLIYN